MTEKRAISRTITSLRLTTRRSRRSRGASLSAPRENRIIWVEPSNLWFVQPTSGTCFSVSSLEKRAGLNEHLMRYREIDYTVVQGLEGQVWKWEVSIETNHLRGKAATRPEPIKLSARLTGH